MNQTKLYQTLARLGALTGLALTNASVGSAGDHCARCQGLVCMYGFVTGNKECWTHTGGCQVGPAKCTTNC